MKKAKSLLKIGAVYMGTVLGAGFASGQELLQFFVRFSYRGLLGCTLAGVLFCLLGAIILSKSYGLSEKTYRKYLKTVFKGPLSSFLAFVGEVFLCVSFCIMLSGSGAFFAQRLFLPPLWGILLTDAICLCVFLYDIKGLSVLNLILTPIMLLGTVYVAFHSIFTGSQTVFLPQVNPHGLFLPYAVFYVGYNMLTAAAVLVPAAALAEDRKTAVRGGVFGGLMLTVLAVLCSTALFVSDASWDSPLPMLLLSKQAGTVAYFTYSAVLFMAMLTTAVSTGFSVVQRLCSLGMGQKGAAVSVCLAAIPLSFFEFSALVRYCYLFFGVLGILLVGGILWEWFKRI
ncbi:MAG: hypothetical protein IJF61_05735 [Clostridia bacterium]|nr:hypothetical protein [Clostridia bacterium]